VRDLYANCEELDLELGSSKDFLPKAFEEAGVELLQALQNFSSQSKRKPRRIWSMKKVMVF
jgi:hypothetical protein